MQKEAPVFEDGLCTCQHCGYQGVASEFYLDTKYMFIFCNNLPECWARWDSQNGMTKWQARRRSL